MEEKHYLVQSALSRHSTPRHYYTGSKQEAEEAYKNVTEAGALASISFGTPEHYETVKINYEEEI